MVWEIALALPPSIIALAFAYISMHIEAEEHKPLQIFFFFISILSSLVTVQIIYLIADIQSAGLAEIVFGLYTIVSQGFFLVIALTLLFVLWRIIGRVMQISKRIK